MLDFFNVVLRSTASTLNGYEAHDLALLFAMLVLCSAILRAKAIRETAAKVDGSVWTDDLSPPKNVNHEPNRVIFNGRHGRWAARRIHRRYLRGKWSGIRWTPFRYMFLAAILIGAVNACGPLLRWLNVQFSVVHQFAIVVVMMSLALVVSAVSERRRRLQIGKPPVPIMTFARATWEPMALLTGLAFYPQLIEVVPGVLRTIAGQ